MKIPPLLLGGVMLFWGWQSGMLWLGALLGTTLELERRLPWHWELKLRDRQRIADLCMLLFILAALYFYFIQSHTGSAILSLIQWTPVLLAPLMLAQLYGRRPGMEPSVLFLSRRGQKTRDTPLLDLGPPYVLACLLAAAVVDPSDQVYYPALAGFIAWMLWPARPKRTQLWIWLITLCFTLTLGFGLGKAVHWTQQELEQAVTDWLSERMFGPRDPYRSRTAIGYVGELKGSEDIVLRVQVEQALDRPLLLRSASYNRYLSDSWYARPSGFTPLSQSERGWRLYPGLEQGKLAQISMELSKGSGLMHLPIDTHVVDGLEAARLSRNDMGTIKIQEGPELAHYQVRYGLQATPDPAPGDADLSIPRQERAAVSRVAAQLGLHDIAPHAMLQRITSLFEQQFRYSLQLWQPQPGRTPLAEFLLHQRSGHCEYFASAAVLLLRHTGIPARYANGWSVQEYSPLEESYIVRERHAHAWVTVHMDGRWIDFDPTPPDWNLQEEAKRPWWGRVHDLLAKLRYEFLKARWQEKGDAATYLAWLLIPLAILLGWRIARRSSIHVLSGVESPRSTIGHTTPFHPVELSLAKQGHPRPQHLTLGEWLEGLEQEHVPGIAELCPAVELQYRLQFDPQGISAAQLQQLHTLILQWLRRYA